MMHPAQAAAMAWEANAIEKCRQDPKLLAEEEAGDLCIACMCSHPCICDMYRSLADMRKYYEAHRRIDPSYLPLRQGRAEETRTRSWGIPVDVLMEGIRDIAIADFKKEVERLRDKIRKLEEKLGAGT